jgi:hypothetical protein
MFRRMILGMAVMALVTGGPAMGFDPPRHGNRGNAQGQNNGSKAGPRNGKKAGPQDGSGPIHSPGTGGGQGGGQGRGRR